MINEIRGDRLEALASRNQERFTGDRPPWLDEVYYIVDKRHGEVHKSSARNLLFRSDSHHYFDSYWWAFACACKIRDKNHD